MKELRAALPRLDPKSYIAREEPEALFSSCLYAGLFSEALEICSAYEDAFDKSYALAELADRMAESEYRDRMSELLEQARSLVPKIDKQEDRDAALSLIAKVYAESGMDGEWRTVVDSIQTLDWRQAPLAAMASRRPAAVDELVATGYAILNGPDTRAKAWCMYVPITSCVAAGRFDEALQIVRSEQHGVWKKIGQLAICAALADVRDFGRLREFVGEISAPWLQMHALSLLAAGYHEAGDLRAASEMLQAAVNRFDNADQTGEYLVLEEVKWLLELCYLLARNNLNEEAERLMRRVETDHRIPTNAKPEEFLDCARRSIPDDPSFARKALEFAFRTAGNSRTYSCPRIAAQYQRLGDADTAQAVLEFAVSNGSADSQLDVLATIAEAYRDAQQNFPAEVKCFLATLVPGPGIT